MWSHGGRTYAVVARGRPADLEQVVEVRQQQRMTRWNTTISASSWQPDEGRGSSMTTRWIVAAAAAVGSPAADGADVAPATVSGRRPRCRRSTTARRRARPATRPNLEFTVKDMNGAQVKLADYEGKVILLNYWATWCGPCRVEIPGSSSCTISTRTRVSSSSACRPTTTGDAARLRARMKMNYPVLGRRRRTPRRVRSAVRVADVVRDRTGWFGVRASTWDPRRKEDFEKAIKPLL